MSHVPEMQRFVEWLRAPGWEFGERQGFGDGMAQIHALYSTDYRPLDFRENIISHIAGDTPSPNGVPRWLVDPRTL